MMPLGKHRKRWHILTSLIKEHGWVFGAELGVLGGKNMLHLLDNCPDLHMVGVDLWEPQVWQDDHRGIGGRSYADAGLSDLLTDLKRRIKEKGYENRVHLLQMRTVEAAALIDRPLDFVFVDADHMEAGVREDIATWMPLIRPGGMILGHDFQRGFPGVRRAVDDLCPNRLLYADSVWGDVV